MLRTSAPSYWTCLVGMLVAGIVTGQAVLAGDGPEASTRRRILVLHGEPYGSTWTTAVSSGIVKAFRPHITRVEMKVEFLDLRPETPPAARGELVDALRMKYATHRPEVILCADPDALAFVTENALFPQVPLVVLEADEPETRESTGVKQPFAIAPTVTAALALHPNARELVVITDTTRRGQALREQTESALAQLALSIPVRFLQDVTVNELDDAVGALDAGAIVLFLTFEQDRNASVLHTDQALRLVAARSEAPVYSLWSSLLGEGIVGGKLSSSSETGAVAAELTLRILEGEAASSIPAQQTMAGFQFDGSRLADFGLDERLLPEGSSVLNRRTTYLENHPEAVRLAAVVLCLLLALVVVLVANDLHRRKAQRALLEREENLRVTLDSIGEAVVATDAHGHITQMNPVAEALCGWTAEEALGRPLAEVLVLLDGKTRRLISDPMREVHDSEEPLELMDPTILVCRDGAERQIAESGAPIRRADGTLLGMVLVFRDVTERHALQQRLRQSEKLEAIGRLAGGIAHDFNNMLGGIIGFADILTRRLEDNERLQRHAQSIIRTAHRAADLTDKMLAFGRRGRLEQHPIDLHDCIENALSILERSIDPRIEIVRSLRAPRTVVVGDPSAIESVVLNLGLNARDAMPEGGTLDIATRNRMIQASGDAPDFTGLAPGEYVELRVKDNGAGIAPNVREMVFEPFFTTKTGGVGTGLGLATVHGTVRALGGDVSLRSEVGQGTEITLCLPLSSRQRAKPGTERLQAIHGTGRILLADDEDVIRESTEETLKELGYEVLLARDGEEALSVYREHRGRIDVVLLDLTMPRINGLDCLAAIREINPDQRTLIMSGFGERVAGLEAVSVSMLHKPFDRVRLSHVIAQAVTGKTPTEAKKPKSAPTS